QKHDARRLHYDFRLEMDGVLKSWAVTRGPSLDPEDKRLAVHVEDHPLSYGSFEGVIPKGQYGGGTVILWDRGVWQPIGDARKGYRKGHLEFELEGEKLKGRWHLVRMHGKPGESPENWLLIKGDDEEARREGGVDILEERPES
ncbi:DNA polymerase ligase N-terminal domain-containing protein, partial [Rhizobium sp. BR5]